MLLVSDNSASDLLLAPGGRPAGRNRADAIARPGDLALNRPTVQLIADSTGYALPPEEEWTPEMFKKLYEGTTRNRRKERRAEISGGSPRYHDAGKHGLPYGENVTAAGSCPRKRRALLFGILERCQTGKNRIPGFLLPDTVVAHKTGTIAGTASDVGLITLPDQAGHVALAVYMKGSDKEAREKERTIALIEPIDL